MCVAAKNKIRISQKLCEKFKSDARFEFGIQNLIIT